MNGFIRKIPASTWVTIIVLVMGLAIKGGIDAYRLDQLERMSRENRCLIEQNAARESLERASDRAAMSGIAQALARIEGRLGVMEGCGDGKE